MRSSKNFRLIFAVCCPLLTSGLSFAQQRGSAPSAPAAAPRPIVTMPLGMHAPVHPAAPTAPVRPGSHTIAPGTHPIAPKLPGHPNGPKAPVHSHPVSTKPNHTRGPSVYPSGESEDDGVPGLGFDYPHYAATHPHAKNPHVQEVSSFPFTSGGIYFPMGGYAETEGAAEPPADGQTQEEQDSSPLVAETTPPQRVSEAPRARSNSNPTPAPASEYIFVRRDGTVFFAVAYSWVNGNLQYVTQDGLRKYVSASTLDIDATAQFNEQRGVVFHSPA